MSQNWEESSKRTWEDKGSPSNTRRLTNADLMLGHRLRRWPNIKSTSVQRLVFAGRVITLQPHGIGAADLYSK